MSDDIDNLEGVELARACAEAMGWRVHDAEDKPYVWIDDPRSYAVGRKWRPHDNANHAREMVKTLSSIPRVHMSTERATFAFFLREAFNADTEAYDGPFTWSFTAPLETICKAFLKAKAGAGVKP